MKAKKYLVIITGITCLASIVVAILIGKGSNSVGYDICMAIFGSALLGFIMSLVEYFGERRNSMERFYQEANIALGELRKLQPFTRREPIDMIVACLSEEDRNAATGKLGTHQDSARKAMIDWFRQNDDLSALPEAERDSWLEEKYPLFIKDVIADAQRLTDQCVAVSEIDLRNLDNAYGSLDFIMHNKRIRSAVAYRQIYDVIRKYRNLALSESAHFRLLNDGSGSFVRCFEKAAAISEQFYEVRENTADGNHWKGWHQAVFDQVQNALDVFRCELYHDRKPEIIESKPVCSQSWTAE